MLLVLQPRVHDDAKNLDMISGFNGLSLDGKWLRVRLAGIGGEVYDGSFLRFKRRSTSSFPVESFFDDGFDTLPVALRSRSGHPRGEVIHKRDRSPLAVDLSLYEICVEEEEEDRGQGGEYRRSILVYHASRKCEIPGLECLAKHYVEHFGKELSLHDVLRLTRDVFSTLPEGETWLPNYIKSHLLRLKLGNPNNNLAELYSTLGHDHQFDNTVMKMVVDMLAVNLSDDALTDVLWANGRCVAEEPAPEEPAPEEPVEEWPVPEAPAPEEPVEEWIIPDASSVEGWPNAHLHPHEVPATENLSSASEAFIEAQPEQNSLTRISVADLAFAAEIIQATLEHVTSPDTFMTFFLTYTYEDLRSDEGHAVDSDITHALVFFEGFSSWEPEQINKLHGGLEKLLSISLKFFSFPLEHHQSRHHNQRPRRYLRCRAQHRPARGSVYLFLMRDRHRCVVSRKFDRAAARKHFEENAESCADDDGNPLKDESSDQFRYLEVAHILPHCLTTVASGETDLSDSKKNALRILDMFDPGITY
ncbi:hypothetical protein CBS147330_5242 [Penicillium roqueforti]|nr:hypothetical protein CBS147330_5242 [Penicillium roqueforti]